MAERGRDFYRAIGRIGAHTTHAFHDAKDTTAAGRAAFLARFEAAVDPDGRLSPEERRRRAEHLRRAHMARLAQLSAESRRRRLRAGGRAEEQGVPAVHPPQGDISWRGARAGTATSLGRSPFSSTNARLRARAR